MLRLAASRAASVSGWRAIFGTSAAAGAPVAAQRGGMAAEAPRLPVPPFTAETAEQKVQLAEDAWNSCNPEKVSKGYTVGALSARTARAMSGQEVSCRLSLYYAVLRRSSCAFQIRTGATAAR